MAAPTGNHNARKGKEWFDALRKECVQRGSLDKIAKVLLDKAESGEAWAIQEVANRFDGKPAQAVELSGAVAGMTHEEWLASLK
jgi:hypothetical protein